MKFKVGAEKPPLSKTDSPVPGEVARSARRGAGGHRRWPEGFRRAMPCALSHRQTGRNPSASQARHLPLTREAFHRGARVGDSTEGLLWPEAGTAARGLAALRAPFWLDVGRGAPTPPKLAPGRMLRDWQTVGADSISARGSVSNRNKIRCKEGLGASTKTFLENYRTLLS